MIHECRLFLSKTSKNGFNFIAKYQDLELDPSIFEVKICFSISPLNRDFVANNLRKKLFTVTIILNSKLKFSVFLPGFVTKQIPGKC